MISLLLAFILQLIDSGDSKLVEGVIAIAVNLLCSYFAACVFLYLVKFNT